MKSESRKAVFRNDNGGDTINKDTKILTIAEHETKSKGQV